MTTYNLPTHYEGDTYDGVQFVVNVNGNPLDLTNAVIVANFKHRNLFSLSTVNGGISKLPTPGAFQIDEQVIGWPEGNYKYEIQIKIGDKIKTYITGIFQIKAELTT